MRAFAGVRAHARTSFRARRGRSKSPVLDISSRTSERLPRAPNAAVRGFASGSARERRPERRAKTPAPSSPSARLRGDVPRRRRRCILASHCYLIRFCCGCTAATKIHLLCTIFGTWCNFATIPPQQPRRSMIRPTEQKCPTSICLMEYFNSVFCTQSNVERVSKKRICIFLKP